MQQAIPEWLSKHIVEQPGCWGWTGTVVRCYGGGGGDRAALSRGGRSTTAARWMWEAVYGDIPSGLFVLHACDNALCVRPDHLHLGTAKQNSQEALMRGRLRPGGTAFVPDPGKG